MASIDPRFIIERQGKQFILYAGLIDEAHNQGLAGISTRLLQIPNKENEYVAVCEATVTLQDKSSDRTRMFSGIGDASSGNVTKAIETSIIRMAETRAKARALRDALNIGAMEIEGVEDDAEGDDRPTYGARAEDKTPAASSASKTTMTGEPATEAQINAIYGSGKKHGYTEASIETESMSRYGRLPKELSKKEASDLIGMFNKK